MRNAHFEPEIDGNIEALINDICGRTKVNQFEDDFGSTEWLDEWMEDFIGG